MIEVTLSVQGAGQVTAGGGAIQCGNGGTTCVGRFPVGTTLTLTADPAIGNGFTTWSDACQGTNPTCDLVLTGNATVTAAFAPAPPRTLTIVVSGFLGTVSDLGGVVSCIPGSNGSATCSQSFAAQTPITLVASPLPGAQVFVDWQSCPNTVGSDCTIVMDGDRTVNVAFAGGCVAVLTLPDACTLVGNFDCCFRSDGASPYDLDGDGYLDCSTNCGIEIDRCYAGTASATPCDCNDSNSQIFPGQGC